MFSIARALVSVTGDALTLVTAVQTSSTIVEVRKKSPQKYIFKTIVEVL
jgi:hypothetical protein